MAITYLRAGDAAAQVVADIEAVGRWGLAVVAGASAHRPCGEGRLTYPARCDDPSDAAVA